MRVVLYFLKPKVFHVSTFTCGTIYLKGSRKTWVKSKLVLNLLPNTLCCTFSPCWFRDISMKPVLTLMCFSVTYLVEPKKPSKVDTSSVSCTSWCSCSGSVTTPIWSTPGFPAPRTCQKHWSTELHLWYWVPWRGIFGRWVGKWTVFFFLSDPVEFQYLILFSLPEICR